MNELKDFLIFAAKNPLLWSVAIVWLAENVRWLIPSTPEQVLNSFTNLVTTVGIIVVAYLGGKYVESQGQRRALAKQLSIQAPLSTVQQLNEVKLNE